MTIHLSFNILQSIIIIFFLRTPGRGRYLSVILTAQFGQVVCWRNARCLIQNKDIWTNFKDTLEEMAIRVAERLYASLKNCSRAD